MIPQANITKRLIRSGCTLIAMGLSFACSDLAVMIGSAGRAKKASGISELKLNNLGQFDIAWDVPSGEQSSDLSYEIYGEKLEQIPSDFSASQENILNFQIYAAKDELSLTSSKKLLGKISESNHFVWDETPDTRYYYAFEIRPTKAKIRFENSKLIAKIGFAEPKALKVSINPSETVSVSWGEYKGVESFEIYKDGLFFKSTKASNFDFELDQSRSPGEYCVRARIGNILSHECHALDRIGSNWRPLIKSVQLINPQSYYKTGDELQFEVRFTDPITLKSASTLSLPLEFQSPASADYTSGSGSDTWVFKHLVTASDSSSDIRFAHELISSSPDAATSNGAILDPSLPITETISSIVDSTAPSAPLSPGFALAASHVTQVSISFGPGQDLNFDGHEIKLCAANDCSTGCLASIDSSTSPVAATGLPNQSYYACVRSSDKALNYSAWVSSLNPIIIDTIPPTVSAGADLLAKNSVVLDATSSGATRLQWSQISGPGTLSFSTATAEDSSVQADIDGSYTIQIKAIDAAGNEAVDDMTLTWDTSPPSFAMGSDRYLKTSTLVDVTVTGAATYQWTKLSGPGTITFGSATSEDTTVSANTEGFYVLRLTATDLAGNSSTSDLNVTWDVTAPTVNVGADVLSKTQISITPTIAGADYYAWSKSSGSGNISFGTASEANTSASADSDDNYVLRLTVSDEAGNTAYDELTLTWDTTAPSYLGLSAHFINNDDTSGRLRWSPALDAFTPRWDLVYDICQSATPGQCASNFTTTYTTEAGATSFYLSGLDPLLNYEYIVRVRDLLGNRDSNTKSLTTRKISNVVQLSAGKSFTCARYADETVACWGRGDTGRLGDGLNQHSESPRVVSGLSNVIQIAAGLSHTCALISDGTVRCWGQNSSGQLGDSTTTVSAVPVPVTGINNAIQIASGTYFSCATLSDYSAKCWGINDYGQLGDGTTTNRSIPVNVAFTSDIRSMAIGESFACAIIGTARTVQCWGKGDNGRLGYGSNTSSTTAAVTVTGLTGVTNIYASNYKACATVSGGLRCWGNNGWGQLGNSTNTDRNTPVTAFANGSNVADVSLGEFFSCAILSDGTSRCWGNNGSRQLGLDQDWGDRWEPVMLKGDPKFIAIASGSSHSCAVVQSSGGSVKCWGANSYGERGTSTKSDDVVYPTVVNSADTFTKVAAGGYHSCGLLANQTVQCWGANTWGQVADGTQYHIYTPKLIPGITTAVDIASGLQGSCAVLANGTIKCWGENNHKQNGDGTTNNSYSPVTVQNINNALSIGAGEYHYCALLSDATVQCWGQNNEGQLGNAANIDNGTPQTVSGLSSVTQLSVGYDHSCAKANSGTVYCWGSGDFGELGQGTSSGSNIPIAVTVASNISKITAAWDFTCAVLNDGTAKCWGYGSGGELGNGVFSHSTSAVGVQGLTAIQELYAWGDHACAKMSSSNIQCWGGNSANQLGVVTSDISIPTRLALTDVSSLSTGYFHTCSLSGAGKLRCWGSNSYGQLGMYELNEAAWARAK